MLQLSATVRRMRLNGGRFFLQTTLAVAMTITSFTADAGPTLNVNAATSRQPISEDIYGLNQSSEALAADLRLPVRRWGGNDKTRYNWKADLRNTAKDYFYENIPESNVATLPNGSTADLFVEQNRRTNTRSIITVPLIGWTPKASSARNHPYDCAFKISKYGAQQSSDPYDTNCGNGVLSNGTNITNNDPLDTSEAITPTFVSDWIAHLIGRYGTAANGGVNYYNLDNEPMLWHKNHRDVRPNAVTYNDLRDRTYLYAAAVKAADPGSKTFGPVLWGWCAYLYSAADDCSPGSDYSSHGNTYFVPWYLQQMKSYEQTNGVRILDYLDVHYYPQAGGVEQGSAGDANLQALRLRTTRSLWDPTYIDESWISQTANGGVAIQLIPRLKSWISANYPGTKTAITEYNFGALDDMNGALTQADVLGIFGREGVDLATLWQMNFATNHPGAYAFRMYRNYDGTGKRFGETSVSATSTDQSVLSVYAAERTSDRAMTVLVINKSTSAQTSTINLSGFQPGAAATVYRYSSANLGAIVQQTDATVASNAINTSFPASSITMLVIPAAANNVVGANCVLDINGDLRLTADIDGVLLLRHLFGFKDDALTRGITMSGTRTASASISTFIGTAAAFDVFGRNPTAPPQAMTDALIMLRVLLGVPNASLLNGTVVPSGAQYANAAAVRANINGKCNTQL